MGTVKVIARITGLVAIWRLVRPYLNSSETHLDKHHSQDLQKHNEVTHISTGMMSNSNAFDAMEWRKSILDNVMVALADPNTYLIGVYGSHDDIKDTLLQRVYRRVQRDKLFDMVLITTAPKKPDANKIQGEIARQLGFTFNQKHNDKRAIELLHRIKNEQRILIALCDLSKGFDLRKVGIPYGAEHTGCKKLLTSIRGAFIQPDAYPEKFHGLILFNDESFRLSFRVSKLYSVIFAKALIWVK